MHSNPFSLRPLGGNLLFSTHPLCHADFAFVSPFQHGLIMPMTHLLADLVEAVYDEPEYSGDGNQQESNV